MKKQNDVMFRAVGELEADILEKAEASRAGAGSRRRRKPHKLILPIAATLLFMAFMVFASSAEDIFRIAWTSDPNDWFDPSGGNVVQREAAEQICVGMSFDEIVNRIGKPQRDVASGLIIFSWDIKNNEYLVVWFNADFIAVRVEITDVDPNPWVK